MLLSYWGWEGDQTVTAAVLKPRREDRNVMPYEMLDYVNSQTEFTGVVRYGGNIELVKKLVAAGYPVLIERGLVTTKEGWMGHYGIITGYDDAKQQVRIPDSYLGDITMSYDEISRYWDQFDDIYLVVYPYDKTEEVVSILGPQWDQEYNLRFALEQTTARIDQLEGMDLFFAWYSRGSILVELQDYAGAAVAYDQAFAVYDQLPTDQRPWRVFWYQTGPYFAYYNTARYQDVLNLANYVLEITTEDAIPETWVWRGRANKMLGNWDAAVSDFKSALEWHPDWWVAENELAAMGVTP
jgi:tetratricopeptide (TPR) repeat protein